MGKKQKHILWEVLLGFAFVGSGTFVVYYLLANIGGFWTAQNIWSMVLIVCWMVVASGYWHQGWIIRKAQSATNVSYVLPVAVFVVQCILFIKGIYYDDYSLVTGAVMVNSAVAFNLYQIFKI